MSETYIFWKTAHIVSAAVLFGTGLGIAFFAWFGYRVALRSGNIGGLRLVLRLTVMGDLVFTTPAVVFQFLSGLMLVYLNDWSLTSPWVLSVVGLYICVGLLWLPVVWLQLLQSREAERVQSIEALGRHFHGRFTLWFVLGVPAFLLVLVLFYLMVSKALPVI